MSTKACPDCGKKTVVIDGRLECSDCSRIVYLDHSPLHLEEELVMSHRQSPERGYGVVLVGEADIPPLEVFFKGAQLCMEPLPS